MTDNWKLNIQGSPKQQLETTESSLNRIRACQLD